MYGAALFTLIATAGSGFGLVVTLVTFARRKRDDGKARSLAKQACAVGIMMGCGVLAFLGRWHFLVGFVKLAGDLYVPIPPALYFLKCRDEVRHMNG